MIIRTAARYAAAGVLLALGVGALTLATSPHLLAQSTSRIAWMYDGSGQALTGTTEGSYRALATVLIDTVTNAPVVYVADSRAAGVVDSTTMRTVEATDSQLSAGVGATGDSAATAGSTGSLSAKQRLMTSQLDAIQTSMALVDDDQTGASKCGITSAASTNSTSCKGSAGRVLGIYATNTTTTVYYLRLYESSSAPTCSSATGFIQSYPIPPASAAGQVGGFSFPFPPAGLAYATGIGYCITGGSSSTDNTNAATGVFGTIAYK